VKVENPQTQTEMYRKKKRNCAAQEKYVLIADLTLNFSDLSISMQKN
jgi:hypothetical protein